MPDTQKPADAKLDTVTAVVLSEHLRYRRQFHKEGDDIQMQRAHAERSPHVRIVGQ